THYLLMVNREPNENNPTLKRLIEAVKDMQKESEKGIKKPKLETPSEWGHNYSEFKGDGLGTINKLLETKKGFVAGAFYKEGLGDIDLVWGNKDYGLEHILKRREKQAKNQGLNEQQAKEYALNIAKTIPEVIEKGNAITDNYGRMAVEYKNIRVGLNDKWDNQKLPNKWVVSSYEIYNSESESPFLLMTQLQGVGLGTPKLTEPNPTTKKLNKD
uniref:putative barnase/colicin E5 family endoribonuclease n=1 Tax=Helicobacter pylori TaxID=210 RepID=UPI00165C5F1E